MVVSVREFVLVIVGLVVLAFLTTAAVLRLVTDRAEPARRVLGASVIVGVVTIVVDLFG